MTDIKLEVNANKSVIAQESKPVAKSDDALNCYYTVNDRTSIYDNSNSVSSIQKENLNYSNTEKLNEDYHVIVLERQVYNFISEGNTKKARELLDQFDNYSSPQIDKWKKALSLLSIKKTGVASLQKKEIEEESKWVHENSKYFVSKWVALTSGGILAFNDRLEDLKKEVESINKKGNVTFLKL